MPNFAPFQTFISCITYLKNRLSHSSLNNASPYETLASSKIFVYHVRDFGCVAFVFNNNSRFKIHGKAVPAIHLGGFDIDVYTFECMATKKIVRAVRVTLDETVFPVLKNIFSSSENERSSDSES